MKRRMSNLTKDKLRIIGFIIFVMAVIWVLTGAVLYVKSLFAQEITEVESMNKFYAEETIKSEMRFLAMKHYMDNISVEEYIDTFFKGEIGA